MSERDFELAEAYAAAERDSGVSRIQRHLVHEPGAAECEDCGAKIPKDRRHAAPWARRCISCQTKWERTHHG